MRRVCLLIVAETVVVTLSGVVEVTNRLAGTGRVERLEANEAARISGVHDPSRLQLTPETLRQTLQGLTPSRPREVRSGAAAASVSERVAQVANAGPVSDARPSGSAPSGSKGQHSGKGDAGGHSSSVSGSKGSSVSSPTEGTTTPDRGHRRVDRHRQ